MTPEARKKLVALINVGEGYQRFPYRDTKGYLTIGYGRNLDTVGISESEAAVCRDNDLNFHESELSNNLPYFNELNEIRQMVLISMSYNMGYKNFMKFERMLQAVSQHDYETAGDEMVDSGWYHQIGHRADVLVHMMRTGEL